MTKDRPSHKWVPKSVQAHLDADILSMLAFGERFSRWYAPHLNALAQIDPFDPPAILTWRNHTIDASITEFGHVLPISQIVTTSDGHLKVLQDPCPAYHAIREGARQRDAVYSIDARVAHHDALYTALFEKLDGIYAQLISEHALHTLLGETFGKSDVAYWRAVEWVHNRAFGRLPPIDFETFIAQLPPPKSAASRN